MTSVIDPDDNDAPLLTSFGDMEAQLFNRGSGQEVIGLDVRANIRRATNYPDTRIVIGDMARKAFETIGLTPRDAGELIRMLSRASAAVVKVHPKLGGAAESGEIDAVAKAMANAADDGCFDIDESTEYDPAEYQENDRSYWQRLASLAIEVISQRWRVAPPPLDLDKLRDDVHHLALDRPDDDDLAERIIALIQANEAERKTRADLCSMMLTDARMLTMKALVQHLVSRIINDPDFYYHACEATELRAKLIEAAAALYGLDAADVAMKIRQTNHDREPTEKIQRDKLEEIERIADSYRDDAIDRLAAIRKVIRG
jgi:hypothetical protein